MTDISFPASERHVWTKGFVKLVRLNSNCKWCLTSIQGTLVRKVTVSRPTCSRDQSFYSQVQRVKIFVFIHVMEYMFVILQAYSTSVVHVYSHGGKSRLCIKSNEPLSKGFIVIPNDQSNIQKRVEQLKQILASLDQHSATGNFS